MLLNLESFLTAILGVGKDNITLFQMLMRTVIVYLTALLVVRLGEKRFFGKSTAFDLVLSIILGSVISRAINGSAPFFPTLAASLGLVGIHWLLAVLAFHSDKFGNLIKGHARVLVDNGEIQWQALRNSHLSNQDLRSALRVEAKIDDLAEVKEARLERSGNISVIPVERKHDIIETSVEEGVKTIRIEIQR
jgi:uncharacterized membrane protein YcaP (DUF421 family)